MAASVSVVPLNMWAISSTRPFFVQLDDMAAGTLRVVFLVNFVMRAAKSRVGQMGDADDLPG